MKKIALLMVLIMLITLFASCGQKETYLPGKGGVALGDFKSEKFSVSGNTEEMKVSVSDETATFTQTEKGFLASSIGIWTLTHTTYSGKYEMNGNNNLVIQYDRVVVKREYVADNENIIQEFNQAAIKLNKDQFEAGMVTKEEYDEYAGCLDNVTNEFVESGEVELRLDTENGIMRPVRIETSEYVIYYDYYENGNLKSINASSGLFGEEENHEFDENGYEIIEGVVREFYDNGKLKYELYPNGGKNIFLEEITNKVEFFYDENGFLVKEIEEWTQFPDSENYWDIREYEYNDKGQRIIKKTTQKTKAEEITGYYEEDIYNYANRQITYFALDDLAEGKKVKTEAKIITGEALGKPNKTIEYRSPFPEGEEQLISSETFYEYKNYETVSINRIDYFYLLSGYETKLHYEGKAVTERENHQSDAKITVYDKNDNAIKSEVVARDDVNNYLANLP